jgi:hypothetical protein
VSFLLIFSGTLDAQNLLPITGKSYREIESHSIRKKQTVHLAHRPLHEFFLGDSVRGVYYLDSAKYFYEPMLFIMRRHLLEVKKSGYRLSFDPIGELSLGLEFPESSNPESRGFLYVNNRGAIVSGEIGKRFSFQTGFYEMQRRATSYQRGFVDSTDVFPGYGRVKDFKFEQYDHNMSFGNIAFVVNDNWMLETGYGQQFVGHGYRSLLVSDGVFSYPYLRSTAYFFNKKLLYSNTFGTMQNMERLPLGDVPESLFRRKGYSANYLSFIPISNLEIGLFEASMWQRADSIRTYNLPWNYYLPVIGLASGIEEGSKRQNTIVGANLRYSVSKRVSVYSQLMIDDFSFISMGYQAGIKCFDFLIKGLYLQAEYNHLELRGTADRAYQDFSHFNQYLGHPGGRYLEEWVLIAEYRYRKFISRAKTNWIDSETAIYDLRQSEIEVGLQLNLKTNLELVFGASQRKFDRNYQWYYLTLRTNLHSRYFDF